MKGFSLLEVLIALFILSTVMLGIAGLQVTVLAHNQQARWYSLAVMQSVNMVERMRADFSNKTKEVEIWRLETKQQLPHSMGSCHCRQKHCTVIVKNKLQQVKLMANV